MAAPTHAQPPSHLPPPAYRRLPPRSAQLPPPYAESRAPLPPYCEVRAPGETTFSVPPEARDPDAARNLPPTYLSASLQHGSQDVHVRQLGLGLHAADLWGLACKREPEVEVQRPLPLVDMRVHTQASERPAISNELRNLLARGIPVTEL